MSSATIIHDCFHPLNPMVRKPFPAFGPVSENMRSTQGYRVYLCTECKCVWGCLVKSNNSDVSGDASDWHNFGVVDPADIKRHV